MNQTEKILFDQLQRHATHYIESNERGIVVDDLDVNSFITETSKLVIANGAEQSEINCNIPLVSGSLPADVDCMNKAFELANNLEDVEEIGGHILHIYENDILKLIDYCRGKGNDR